MSLRDHTQAATCCGKALLQSFPSPTDEKQRVGAIAIDSVITENPFLLKEFSVDFLSLEYTYSWEVVELEPTN